jgi:hypothetical protein
MLRNIQTRLVRRLERLAQAGERNIRVAKALERFLADTYAANPTTGYVAAYDEQQKQVTIQTPSKTAASDLLLRSAELSALFRKSGVTLSRLVIR